MMVLVVMIMRKKVDISVARNPSATNILYQTQSEFNHDLQTKHVVDNQQIRRACTMWPSGRERDWGGQVGGERIGVGRWRRGGGMRGRQILYILLRKRKRKEEKKRVM